jgi:tetratricopeptide (TPR) repeat protein
MNAPIERNVSTMIRLALIGQPSKLPQFRCMTMPLFSTLFKSVVCVAVFGLAFANHAIGAPPTTTRPSDSSPETLSEVGAWIERLGHPSYATRVRASEQLQRMGLQAFDELHAAQYHADSEIAMAARHLVSSLLVSWSTETDPEAVRDALDEYGAQTETERQNRMDRLAELPGRQGLAALCRLARFETSLRLSREAALAVMRSPLPEDESTRKREADVIREVLGPNDRRAADWLRAYANDLTAGTFSIDAWRELIRQQRRMMDDGSDPTSTRPAVLELVQVCAARAATAGLREEALVLSIEHLDLIPPRAREVIDACSWAIDNQMHSLVLELQKRHGELFSRQPILLYGAAEALIANNDPAGAEKLANEALVVDPLPKGDSDEAEKLSPKVIEENAQRHREVGRELESRGLFHWAEREYRHIIDASAIDAPIAATARVQLANMLAELERHDDCVAVLEPILKRADEDQQYFRRLNTSQIVARLKATMSFQQGLAALAKKDYADARTKLSAALELDASNADILIAMYRTEGDAAWKEKVRRTIASLALSFENQIEAFKLQVQPRLRIADAGIHLAEYLNQYAWLVSNTEGNYQRALEYSLYSLELNPDAAAQLDTAGRCYYAVNDIPNALRMQRRAIKLMPHSPPLRRQLALFEEAEKALKSGKKNEETSEEKVPAAKATEKS